MHFMLHELLLRKRARLPTTEALRNTSKISRWILSNLKKYSRPFWRYFRARLKMQFMGFYSYKLLKFNTVITGTLLRRIITSDDGSIYRNNNHVSIEMMGSSGRIIDANKTINLPRGNRNSYQFFRTHWLSELVYDTSICSSNYDMSLEHAELSE